MKNIYKLPKGVIVMMIAVTGLVASAGTPLPSSPPGPKYVLYPPTNFSVIVFEACFAYLTWNKPLNPGGATPPGLLGYRIYRDGSLIHYDSDPDSLFFYDYIDNVGTFTDSVTAYYDLTSYGYPGTYGESAAVSGTSFSSCGSILPFYEPWDQASFIYQGWSFVPSQGNWACSTTQGNPLPTAMFTGTPALSNYDHTLQSVHLDCIAWTCANVYIEFDTRLNSNNQTSQEKMIIEINYDSIWHPKDTLVNDTSTGWVHHKIDISDAGGQNARVGFRATGINSGDIVEWDIDNIYVYAVCFRPPDFNLNRTGNIVHLTWGTPCTGKKLKPDKVESSTLLGYNIYRTDESGLPPFVKLNMAMISDTEYTDVLASTFDGVACYYVTAIYEDSLNPAPPYLCESPSDTLCFQYTAGIPEQNETHVRIFPNPVLDVLNIETDQAFTGIEVLNFLGEKIYSGSFPETTNLAVPMKDNPSGNYLLKINFRNGIIVEKVLKK
jgi:hypothetical protein